MPAVYNQGRDWSMVAVLVLLFAGLSYGCRQPTGIPARERAIGEWVMSDGSLAALKRLGHLRVAPQDHRIAIHTDGSCEFQSFWTFTSPQGGPASPRDYISNAERCSWRLESSDELLWSKRKVIGAITVSVDRLVDGTPTLTEITLLLEDRAGADVITASLGHPDDGQILDYVRRQ